MPKNSCNMEVNLDINKSAPLSFLNQKWLLIQDIILEKMLK